MPKISYDFREFKSIFITNLLRLFILCLSFVSALRVDSPPTLFDTFYKQLPSFVHTTSSVWLNSNTISYPWLTLLATGDDFTRNIQQQLWRHQNPSNNCSLHKYYVIGPWNFGFGSDLHVMSIFFAIALSTERIFIFEDQSSWVWINTTLCQPGDYNFDCYFTPISSCKSHAYNALANSDIASMTYKTELRVVQREERPIVLTRRGSELRFANKSLTPPLMHLHSAPYKTRDMSLVSVWRAQATKFFFRPNARMLRDVLNFLATSLLQLSPAAAAPVLVQAHSHPPLQAIGMYIRHGDIYKEMKLTPFLKYIEAAESLVLLHNCSRNIILGKLAV